MVISSDHESFKFPTLDTKDPTSQSFLPNWENSPEYYLLQNDFYGRLQTTLSDPTTFGNLDYSQTSRVPIRNAQGHWFYSRPRTTTMNDWSTVKIMPSLDINGYTAVGIIQDIFEISLTATTHDPGFATYADYALSDTIPYWMVRSPRIFPYLLSHKVVFEYHLLMRFDQDRDTSLRLQKVYLQNQAQTDRLMMATMTHLTSSTHKADNKFVAIFDAFENFRDFVFDGGHITKRNGGYKSETRAFVALQTMAQTLQKFFGPRLAGSFMIWMTSSTFHAQAGGMNNLAFNWESIDAETYMAYKTAIGPHYASLDPSNSRLAEAFMKQLKWLTFLHRGLHYIEPSKCTLKQDIFGASSINEYTATLLNRLAQIIAADPNLMILTRNQLKKYKTTQIFPCVIGQLFDILNHEYQSLFDNVYNWDTSTDGKQEFTEFNDFFNYGMYQVDISQNLIYPTNKYHHWFYVHSGHVSNLDPPADYMHFYGPTYISEIIDMKVFFGAFIEDIIFQMPFQTGTGVSTISFICKSTYEFEDLKSLVEGPASLNRIIPIGSPESPYLSTANDRIFNRLPFSVRNHIYYATGNIANWIPELLYPNTLRTSLPSDNVHFSFPDNYVTFKDGRSIINEIGGRSTADYIFSKDAAMDTTMKKGGAHEYYHYDTGSFAYISTHIRSVGKIAPHLRRATIQALRTLYMTVWNDANLWIVPSSPPSFFDFIINLDKMSKLPTNNWVISAGIVTEALREYGINVNSANGDFIDVNPNRWQFWINHLCSDGHKTDANGVPIFDWVGYTPVGSGIQVTFNPNIQALGISPYTITSGQTSVQQLPNFAYLMGHFSTTLYHLFQTHNP